MEWTRTETLALAIHSCSTCHGLGLMIGKRGKATPCNCVLRNVFRACYKRFRYCQTKEKYMTKVSLRFSPGTDRRRTWGRKDEEYSADFMLIAALVATFASVVSIVTTLGWRGLWFYAAFLGLALVAHVIRKMRLRPTD